MHAGSDPKLLDWIVAPSSAAAGMEAGAGGKEAKETAREREELIARLVADAAATEDLNLKRSGMAAGTLLQAESRTLLLRWLCERSESEPALRKTVRRISWGGIPPAGTRQLDPAPPRLIPSHQLSRPRSHPI